MSEETDAEMVALCLAGNREAFGRIVARYQSLVCSLAYSATGSLTQSEDLAQPGIPVARVALGVSAGLVVLYGALVLGFRWARRRLRSTVFPQRLE